MIKSGLADPLRLLDIKIMEFFVYVLESETDGSFYIGQTSDLASRLERHNRGYNKSTKPKRPWKLIYSEKCSSRSHAMKLEKKFKSWKKREVIINYINRAPTTSSVLEN